MAGVGATPKLTGTERGEIVELLIQGNHSQKSIAAMYSVSQKTISRIITEEKVGEDTSTQMSAVWADEWSATTRKIRAHITRAKRRKVAKMMEGRR